jgi:hypothetical protein
LISLQEDLMRQLTWVVASVTLGIALAPEGQPVSTTAGAASPEDRTYAERIERFKDSGRLTGTRIENPDSSILTLWRQQRALVAVDHWKPLKPYRPELPELGTFNEIAYKRGTRFYFSLVNPGEIRLFWEAVTRATFAQDGAHKSSYYRPNGQLAWEVQEDQGEDFIHFCNLGLFFRKNGKDLYEISGHPQTEWFQLRMTGEPLIKNRVLNGLLEEYTKRSFLWKADHPERKPRHEGKPAPKS